MAKKKIIKKTVVEDVALLDGDDSTECPSRETISKINDDVRGSTGVDSELQHIPKNTKGPKLFIGFNPVTGEEVYE